MKFTKKTEYYTGTVYEWNLPTGHTCPFALECLVKVDRNSGKFKNDSDGYKCYAASAERFPGVRNMRWDNFDFVKNGGVPTIPKGVKAVRIHSSGDFFNQKYFDMWLKLCKDNKDIEFWAYTKSLKYWVNRINDIPENLVLTASYGGSSDELIELHNLKHTIVVKHRSEYPKLPIDYNDDEARKPNVNFILLDNDVTKKKAREEKKRKEKDLMQKTLFGDGM